MKYKVWHKYLTLSLQEEGETIGQLSVNPLLRNVYGEMSGGVTFSFLTKGIFGWRKAIYTENSVEKCVFNKQGSYGYVCAKNNLELDWDKIIIDGHELTNIVKMPEEIFALVKTRHLYEFELEDARFLPFVFAYVGQFFLFSRSSSGW
jgi:hypothetical protein